MKRIKLFEAFTNINKIEKVNFILFNWAIKEFIAEHDLESIMLSEPYFTNGYNLLIIRKIIVNSRGQNFAVDHFRCEVDIREKDFTMHIYCKPKLRKFFIDRNIISANDVVDHEKIVKEVIKKIFIDEKNKTI